MKNLIAAVLGSYGEFAERGWTHLPEIGVRHIQAPVPKPDELDAFKRKLADQGLSAASVQGDCPIGREDVGDAMAWELEVCQSLGAKVLFASVHTGELELNLAYERLRQAGDAAAKHDVTIVMETHPNLVTNGDVGRRTMEAVDHPNVRVNYDTANVYYHNDIPGINAVDELAKVIDYVEGVHMKDTDGGYRSGNFPSLGQGVVDYPEVFRMLNARGFTGPFTIELEGITGHKFDEPGRLKYVADSVDHLRAIGAMD